MRIEDWALVDQQVDSSPQARTWFNLSNGHLGLRGHLDEDGDIADQSFVNGFYETWPITYPEDAYGLARVGQTIQPTPNPASFSLVVDAVRFDPASAELESYERRLDLRQGRLHRNLVWRTPSGVAVTITTSRLVSFTEPDLVKLTYQVNVSRPCHVELTHHLVAPRTRFEPTRSAESDPRRSTRLDHPVDVTALTLHPDLAITVRTPRAGRQLTAVATHHLDCPTPWRQERRHDERGVSHQISTDLSDDGPLRLTVLSSIGEDETRVRHNLTRSGEGPWPQLENHQSRFLAKWWSQADVVVEAPGDLPGRIRWHLFQTLQASACATGHGIAAKGVSGSGYDGHYFWDTEAMVLPCLTYTAPDLARQALQWRHSTLPRAIERARELHLSGAAFPWRTIDGREASAFFEAGTAQFHINADIAYAVNRYLTASADQAFLAQAGIDLLVETARLWADRGFHGSDGQFHIHGVTGPDEYSAIVDDNLYTNVMAAANLVAADHWLTVLAKLDPTAHQQAVQRLSLDPSEPAAWRAAAQAMAIPYDSQRGLHGQDAHFLSREVWDFAHTPASSHPLLLHYHPLTIWRHQVLKQADLVLALITRPDLFSAAQKRADFDYYDPLTTGDSTLSCSGQAIMAAEVGRAELAETYFHQALAIDLSDTHANAADGVHVASAGAVWSILTMGFAGLRDYPILSFDPRLPASWQRLAFRLRLAGSQLALSLTPGRLDLELIDPRPSTRLDLTVRAQPVQLSYDHPSLSLELADPTT